MLVIFVITSTVIISVSGLELLYICSFCLKPAFFFLDCKILSFILVLLFYCIIYCGGELSSRPVLSVLGVLLCNFCLHLDFMFLCLAK